MEQLLRILARMSRILFSGSRFRDQHAVRTKWGTFCFEEIELLIDRSVDFLNSAASRLDFSCTPIQNSAAEQTCSQQPKTARNPGSGRATRGQ
jgi:hypothetical protein